MNKQELSAMVAQILASMQAEPAVKASDYKPADPGPQPVETGYGDGDFVEDVSRLDLYFKYFGVLLANVTIDF